MSSCSTDLHFFKKIEEGNHGELRIPRNFVSKYWEGLANPVLLLLPNGANWKVNWKKVDADVWLINGWRKFAKFYSLDKGHLLLFKYVSGSRFRVVIFDQSCLEIGYPWMEERTLHNEENNNYVSNRERSKFPLPSSHSTKNLKSNTRKKPNCNPSQDVETIMGHTDPVDDAKPKEGGKKKILHANKRSSKSEAIQTSLCALERAKAFSSENPFFVQKMYRSYIKKSCFMSMPRNFIPEDQRSEDDSVTLWMSEKSWRVKFSVNHSSGQIILNNGWKNFVKDNNLKIGDVCVFEKIKKPGISFRVVIFHGDCEESSSPGCKCPRCDKVLENHFTSEITRNQFFQKSVPLKFMKDHNIDKEKMVTLQIGKKSWPVKLTCYSEYKVCKFSSGWCAFMRENNLKAGDVCYFELVDKKKVLFEVRITSLIN